MLPLTFLTVVIMKSIIFRVKEVACMDYSSALKLEALHSPEIKFSCYWTMTSKPKKIVLLSKMFSL
jgi:hypothetical protein